MSEEKNHMDNILYLSCNIHLETEKEFMKHFMNKITKKTNEVLTMYINSFGGEMTDSLGLASMIMTAERPVKTIAIGSCYSGATAVFLGADKRACFKHTSFLFHGPRTYFGWGNTKEFQNRSSNFTTSEKLFIEYYKERLPLLACKKVEKAIKQNLNWVVNGEEALELGIVDEIIGEK